MTVKSTYSRAEIGTMIFCGTLGSVTVVGSGNVATYIGIVRQGVMLTNVPSSSPCMEAKQGPGGL